MNKSWKLKRAACHFIFTFYFAMHNTEKRTTELDSIVVKLKPSYHGKLDFVPFHYWYRSISVIFEIGKKLSMLWWSWQFYKRLSIFELWDKLGCCNRSFFNILRIIWKRVSILFWFHRNMICEVYCVYCVNLRRNDVVFIYLRSRCWSNIGNNCTSFLENLCQWFTILLTSYEINYDMW